MPLDKKDVLEELVDVVKDELYDIDETDIDKIVSRIKGSASLSEWKDKYARDMIPGDAEEIFEFYSSNSYILSYAEGYRCAYSILDALKKGIYDYVIEELDDFIDESLEAIVEELTEED